MRGTRYVGQTRSSACERNPLHYDALEFDEALLELKVEREPGVILEFYGFANGIISHKRNQQAVLTSLEPVEHEITPAVGYGAQKAPFQ